MPSGKSDSSQIFKNPAKDRRRSRNIENRLHLPVQSLFDRIDLVLQLSESLDLIVTTGQIRRLRFDPAPDFRIQLAARKLVDRIDCMLSEFLIWNRSSTVADQVKIGR